MAQQQQQQHQPQQQDQQQDLLSDLPDGALARILALLPARDLAAAQAASRRLRASAAAPPLWRSLLRRDFGLPLAAPARREETTAADAGAGAPEFDALGAYATLADAVGPPEEEEEEEEGRSGRASRRCSSRRTTTTTPKPNKLHALRFTGVYCDGGVDRDNHDDYSFDHALCPNRWAPYCSESAVDVSIVGLLNDDQPPPPPQARLDPPPPWHLSVCNANDAVIESFRGALIERCRLAACQMYMKRVDFSALAPPPPQQQQQQEGPAAAAAMAAATTAAAGGEGGGGQSNGNNNHAATNPATTTATTTTTDPSAPPPLSVNAATGLGPLRNAPAGARCAALAAAEATLAAWPTTTLSRLFLDLWNDLQEGEAMHGGAGTVPLDPEYAGPGRWGRLLLLEADEAAGGGGGGGGGGGEGGTNAANNPPAFIDPFRGAVPTERARSECASYAQRIVLHDRLLFTRPFVVDVPGGPAAATATAAGRQGEDEQQQQQQQQPQGAASSSPHFAPYCLAKARRPHRLVDVFAHRRHFCLPDISRSPDPTPAAAAAAGPPPPRPFGRRGVTACVREVVVSRAGELTCPVAAGVVMLGQVSGASFAAAAAAGPEAAADAADAPAPPTPDPDRLMESLYERLTGADPSVPDGFGELMAQRAVEAAEAAPAARAALAAAAEAAAAAAADPAAADPIAAQTDAFLAAEAAARPPPALPPLLTALDVLRASKAGVLPPVLAHHVVDGGEAEWIEFCPPQQEEEENEEDEDEDEVEEGEGAAATAVRHDHHHHPRRRSHRRKTSPLPLVLWWRFAARHELPPDDAADEGWDPGEGALVSEMAVEWAVGQAAAALTGTGTGAAGAAAVPQTTTQPSAGAAPAAANTNAANAASAANAALLGLFFGAGGDGVDASAGEMLQMAAAAGGIAGGWANSEDDEDEELATAGGDGGDEEEDEEFFDEAEEADAPLTDSDGLTVGIGAAAAAGAGAGVAGPASATAAATAAAAPAAQEAEEDEEQGEPDDEVPWDAYGEEDAEPPTPTPAPLLPPQQMQQLTPAMAAVIAAVGGLISRRGPVREGMRRRELLPHVEAHPGQKTVFDWPSAEAARAGGGGDGVSRVLGMLLYGGAVEEGEEEEEEEGDERSGSGSDGGEDGSDGNPSQPPQPRFHRTDLLPSEFSHASAAITLRGEPPLLSSQQQQLQQQQPQHGLAVLDPPFIADFEAPLVRSTPGERVLASQLSNVVGAANALGGGGGGYGAQAAAAALARCRRRQRRRRRSSPAPPLPPAQPTHVQVRMRLAVPRCGNTLVVRLLQPEDRMAEFHDNHPAPNVDVSFVSVRGVAVRLAGGGARGGAAAGAELRADVEA